MKLAYYLAFLAVLCAMSVAFANDQPAKNAANSPSEDPSKLDESYVDDDIDNDVDEDSDENDASEEFQMPPATTKKSGPARKSATTTSPSPDSSSMSDESYENLDSSSLNELDLDELHPNETNCRLTFSTSNSNVPRYAVFCSKIPRFCSHVCESIKKIDFDEKIKIISPFSFSSYRAKESLELNFKSTLAKIDADAFNGLVIEQDVQMKVNIIGNLDELNSKIIYLDSGFKSTQEALNKQKLQALNIMPNAFRGINIMEGGRLIVTIRNLNRVVFDSQSLTGLKQLARSSVIFSVDHVSDVIFKSKCAKSWQAYNKQNRKDDIKIVDQVDDYEYNMINKQSSEFKHIEKSIANVLFKLNLTNIDTAVFETDSFSDIRQSKQSAFQILLNKFNDAKFGRLSFNQLKQNFMSSFELSLTAGRRILVSGQAFANLMQAEKSRYTLYFDIGESSICLPNEAFVNFTQQANSTVRLSFGLNNNNNLVFKSQSIKNLAQDKRSLFQIMAAKPYGVTLENEAISVLNQSKQSSFEISVLSARSYFKLESASIAQFKQSFESVLRISMGSLPSKQSTKAVFKQATATFNNFVSYPTAQVIYEIAPGIKVDLKFPQRPIPRMLPMSLDGANRESIEEFAYKNFPNLGRLSRPDLIDLRSLNIKSEDFCKVIDVPFDVLVRLKPSTECSCSVYYLYRKIRLFSRLTVESDDMEFPPLPYNGDEANTWLRNAPDCYRKIVESSSGPGESHTHSVIQDIQALENMCKFDERVEKCRAAEQEAAANAKGTSEKLLGQCIGGSFEFYQTPAASDNNLRPVMSQQTIMKIGKNQKGTRNDFKPVDNDSDDNESEYESREDSDAGKDENSDEDDNDEDLDDDPVDSDSEEDSGDDDQIIIDSGEVGSRVDQNRVQKTQDSQTNSQFTEGTSFVERSTMAIYQMLNSSSTIALVVIVVTSVVLIGIVVFVAFILKFKHREILYSEEYKDDDDDDDDDDENSDDSDDDQYHRMRQDYQQDEEDNDEGCTADHYHEGVCDPKGCRHGPDAEVDIEKNPTAKIINPTNTAASKLRNLFSMSNILKRKRLQQKQYSYSVFDKSRHARSAPKPSEDAVNGQNYVVVNCEGKVGSRAASTTTTSSIINLPLDAPVQPAEPVCHGAINASYDRKGSVGTDSGTVSSMSVDDDEPIELETTTPPPPSTPPAVNTSAYPKFMSIKTNPFSLDAQDQA